MNDPKCVARHTGLWLAEPQWLAAAVRAAVPATETDGGPPPIATTTPDGIAVINVVGAMVKGQSKFAGTTNTLAIRRAVRDADAHPDVKGILLYVDSPGGRVDGIADLADDVRAADKPTVAHIDDMGASAAYWAVAGAGAIFANQTAEVGSIGVIASLEDTSGQAEAAGVKVHVVTSAPFKAVGMDGLPVTDEHLAYLQERVDAVASMFHAAVKKGRRLSESKMAEVASGKVFDPARAEALGLIDGIRTMDGSVGELRRMMKERDASARQKRRLQIAQRR